MTDAPSTVRLNANQRRHFEVLFARLEDSLARVETLLDRRQQPHQILGISDDDIPVAFRTTAPQLLEHLRQKVSSLARALDLQPRRASRRRIIQATLTAEAVRIEDSLGAQMRGYGQVDPSVLLHLDPELSAIARTLNNLAASLDKHAPPASPAE